MQTNNAPSVFVLGPSGFIGSRVWKAAQDSAYTTAGLQRKSRVFEQNGTLYKGDITRFNWAKLNTSLPYAIIHTARISGKTTPQRYIAGWRGWLANRRLENWRRDRDVRMVFASGTLVYGDCGTKPVTESSPLQPIAFQRHYVRAEKPFLQALEEKRCGLVITRLPWVYGGGSWLSQFYVKNALQNGYVTQYGSGNQLMSLLHVDDAASMMLDLAVRSNAHGVFNLFSGEPITHGDFCRIISKILGLPVKEMTENQIFAKYGRTVTEALTFSSNIRSEREETSLLTSNYPDVEKGLKLVINELLYNLKQ
jgi:nucleoside-diphosphate-sugar epimerase